MVGTCSKEKWCSKEPEPSLSQGPGPGSVLLLARNTGSPGGSVGALVGVPRFFSGGCTHLSQHPATRSSGWTHTWQSCVRMDSKPTTNQGIKKFLSSFWFLGETSPLVFTATSFLHDNTKGWLPCHLPNLCFQLSAYFRKPHGIFGSWSSH